MYSVYALYSKAFDKIYIGFTSDLETRIYTHNSLTTKGFTAKFRPWIIVYTENYDTKKEAMIREKQLKSASGRSFIRRLIIEKNFNK